MGPQPEKQGSFRLPLQNKSIVHIYDKNFEPIEGWLKCVFKIYSTLAHKLQHLDKPTLNYYRLKDE